VGVNVGVGVRVGEGVTDGSGVRVEPGVVSGCGCAQADSKNTPAKSANREARESRVTLNKYAWSLKMGRTAATASILPLAA
jgi:hypothetical protein